MAILLGILAVLVFGIVPMVVYALILWWFDRYEKEPAGLLIAAFLWGAVPAIILSLIVELGTDYTMQIFVDPVAAELIGASVVAPIVEEIVKAGALVLLILLFRKEIDSPLDGIIYGGLVGFGFAAVENVLYFASALAEGGTGGLVFLTLLRAFVFGLNHALFTGLTGLGVALARTSSHWLVKIGAPFVGLAAGIVAHAIHNGTVTFAAELCWPCLFTMLSDYGGALFMLGVIIWASLRERQWIARFLADEVGLGTLRQDQYEIACSYWNRVAARWGVLFTGDFRRWWELGRFYQLATELAFSKHRLARFPHEQDTQVRIVRLRGQVAELARRM